MGLIELRREWNRTKRREEVNPTFFVRGLYDTRSRRTCAHCGKRRLCSLEQPYSDKWCHIASPWTLPYVWLCKETPEA